MAISISAIAIISILICLSICTAPVDDEVTSSFPNYPHTIYSGYLDINVVKLGSMHYVYFQSQDKPSTDPVIIWLAGGPGCSGLISMMQQNGPFIIHPGTHNAVLNQHSWNKQANLVYFEAPLGTGFSINNDKDLPMNDQTAAKNLLSALDLFINRHASLKKNDFYIAGSGYGAVFAAKLARAIVDQNNDQDIIFTTKIKIKGVLLGNPCVSPDECYDSFSQRKSKYHYQFLYTRGFLSKQMYDSYLGKCLIIQQEFDCYQERKKLDDFIKTTNTSLYNIYVPCYKDNSNSSQNTIDLGCEDQSGTITYLNDKVFRQNWNIRDDKEWQPCNKTVWRQYQTGNGSYHLLHKLVKDNLKVWVYSGDMDSTIPTIGTKAWVNNYRRQYEIPTKNHWREWWIQKKHSKIDQVGGFVWELSDLTVVNIKGAGFKAGYDQPQATSKVIQAFLTGTPLPRKHVTIDELDEL